MPKSSFSNLSFRRLPAVLSNLIHWQVACWFMTALSIAFSDISAPSYIIHFETFVNSSFILGHNRAAIMAPPTKHTILFAVKQAKFQFLSLPIRGHYIIILLLISFIFTNSLSTYRYARGQLHYYYNYVLSAAGYDDLDAPCQRVMRWKNLWEQLENWDYRTWMAYVGNEDGLGMQGAVGENTAGLVEYFARETFGG